MFSFYFFVAKICSVVTSTIKLPTNSTFYTDNQLSTVKFPYKDIGRYIQNLNGNKSHGQNNISICML